MMPLFRDIRVLLIVILLAGLTASAGQKSASLHILVVRDADGKPVRNAEIVLHPVDKHGNQKNEGLELKTHDDGKAQVAGIPYGTLRVQVICPGFRTFGEDYSISNPKMEITIKLEKPVEQHSIYK